MPCYQVNTISLKFSAKSKDRLITTLKEMGYNPTVVGETIIAGDMEFDLAEERVELRDMNRVYARVNAVRRKYTETTIKEIAKKKRWAFKMMEENKIRLMRG